MTLGKITPILRIFDEVKAKEFYVDFLGFAVAWEHRFAPDLPLYMGISKGDCVLHLSEHFGDGCPGAALRIETDDVDAYNRELIAKQYKNARPGIESQPWGTREMTIHDPFGNRLMFVTTVTNEIAGDPENIGRWQFSDEEKQQ
jgi:uncharacterized glyoxalase superfamily protein PhnB